MHKILIKNATIVNEGNAIEADLLIEGERIKQIAKNINDSEAEIIDAKGKILLPGVIDDQVHFREPGLTHKAEIKTESAAAAAGGITSFMEMPNTNPQTLTQELLEDKFNIAKNNSYVNYSFFMGASNDNIEEVLKTNPKNVAGVKVFMGSSTGNMLVDSTETLENIFSKVPMLIATHCEDEATIRKNTQKAIEEFGEEIPIRQHPIIRDEEACYISSSKAVELAKKHNARLHILHISSAKETHLFTNEKPLSEKRITSEVCVHHLNFDDSQYDEKGTFIKWNPAVKSQADQDELWKALLDDRLDIIATDHAPHTLEEKSNSYLKAPSGGPLVQHALPLMLDAVTEGKISYEKVVEKMSHAPAVCFQLEERGFLREGYYADIVLVEKKDWEVSKDNLLYKCGWSPFEGRTFKHAVTTTFVNGKIVYKNGEIQGIGHGKRLTFDRK
ncbi:MAG: dihydroorotase [Flavobacteriales bacterium]|jgi:dihydroorotase|nr:dihydroorotase [Flavobacteriales bacterium]